MVKAIPTDMSHEQLRNIAVAKWIQSNNYVWEGSLGIWCGPDGQSFLTEKQAILFYTACQNARVEGRMGAIKWHEKMKHTLIINRSDSKCGNCGRSANPEEKAHDTLLGYGDDNGHPGCRHYFKYVTSEYIGFEEDIKKMRSDLEWIECYPVGDVLEGVL